MIARLRPLGCPRVLRRPTCLGSWTTPTRQHPMTPLQMLPNPCHLLEFPQAGMWYLARARRPSLLRHPAHTRDRRRATPSIQLATPLMNRATSGQGSRPVADRSPIDLSSNSIPTIALLLLHRSGSVLLSVPIVPPCSPRAGWSLGWALATPARLPRHQACSLSAPSPGAFDVFPSRGCTRAVPPLTINCSCARASTRRSVRLLSSSSSQKDPEQAAFPPPLGCLPAIERSSDSGEREGPPGVPLTAVHRQALPQHGMVQRTANSWSGGSTWPRTGTSPPTPLPPRLGGFGFKGLEFPRKASTTSPPTF